jgi:hypothetical protein
MRGLAFSKWKTSFQIEKRPVPVHQLRRWTIKALTWLNNFTSCDENTFLSSLNAWICNRFFKEVG